MNTCTILTLAALLGATDDRSADRELLARAAQETARSAPRAEAPPRAEPQPRAQPVARNRAERTVEATQKAPAAGNDLSRAEAQARADLIVAEARLHVIQSRKALQDGRGDEAADLAQKALEALKRLPSDVDASVYELQAEGILAKLSRRPNADRDADMTAGDMPAREDVPTKDYADAKPLDRVDEQSRAATLIARRYAGADVPYVDSASSPETYRDRAIERQIPNKRYGYRPAEEIIDVDGILERDTQRYFYEHALQLAYKFNEADRLTHADEARIAPEGIVEYPDDWQRKVAKREKYKGGVIARSPSWTDKDGREWYMAVYDLHDLIYEPPDFIPKFDLNAASQLQTALNMDALRNRSEIFSGYADDLAAGIPLLRYFGGGGIDDLQFRGPKYNLETQREIVDMIKNFTGGRAPEPATAP